MIYQWYPGHMTKAKRMMQEDMKLIDLVIELLDARAPLASRNPDIDELAKGKGRLVLLNKSDLADDKTTNEWKTYFEEKDIIVLKVNSTKHTDLKPVNEAVQKACSAKIERDRKRGIRNRPVRAMVCGIPNVGKSTFINSYAKKSAAKTGNKPGVTKGKQWIRLSSTLELLDTPGILWPKFEDQSVGLKLAMIGSIKDEILNTEELALELIGYLQKEYPGRLAEVYDFELNSDVLKTFETTNMNNRIENDYSQETTGNNNRHGDIKENIFILDRIARKRGCLLKGGELDMLKAAGILLENFRNGKLGSISLEKPNETDPCRQKVFRINS